MYWVLKLGLQRTDPGKGLGLAVRRQPEAPGAWPSPQLGAHAGQNVSPAEEPHCQHGKGGAWVHHSRLIVSVLTAGVALVAAGSVHLVGPWADARLRDV